MEEELAEWRVRAQDRQVVNEWLAKRVDALQRQLATTTAHLEAQRTATYQAVAREHTAKRELVTARQAVWEEVQEKSLAVKYDCHDTSNKAHLIHDWACEQAQKGQPSEKGSSS